MPSYMVCSQLLIKWKMRPRSNIYDGRCAKFFATPLIIMTMNSMTKKAALGGPSSDETFPLREKTKF